MLKHIASMFGGYIKLVTVKATGQVFVQWVINDSQVIRDSILPLFAKFPPLTTRVHLQLDFVIKALAGMTIEEYFESRTMKYSTRAAITPLFSVVPPYFGT
jgi:hypothetical protein